MNKNFKNGRNNSSRRLLMRLLWVNPITLNLEGKIIRSDCCQFGYRIEVVAQ